MNNSNQNMISLEYSIQTNLFLHDIDVLLLVEEVQGGQQGPEVGDVNEPSSLFIQLLELIPIHVVVVYHVTIVAIGHGLLKKFWPMVIGFVLRTAGSSII